MELLRSIDKLEPPRSNIPHWFIQTFAFLISEASLNPTNLTRITLTIMQCIIICVFHNSCHNLNLSRFNFLRHVNLVGSCYNLSYHFLKSYFNLFWTKCIKILDYFINVYRYSYLSKWKYKTLLSDSLLLSAIGREASVWGWQRPIQRLLIGQWDDNK